MNAEPSPHFYASSLPLIVGAGPHIRVTAQSHPLVFEALETISADSGYECGREVYALPADWAERIAQSETALAILIDSTDRDDFVCGEESDTRAILDRHPELTVAHDLLNAFFDGEDKIHGPLDDAA